MEKFPQVVLKVDFGAGLRLGRGKVRLLECIADTGSISAAARKMEMSYRRAWLLIEELNEIFQWPVVETAAGGSGGGGAKITDFGRRVIAVFRELEVGTDALVKAHMKCLKKA